MAEPSSEKLNWMTEAREKAVASKVRVSLDNWQRQGLVPDMPIEPGLETTRLSRERGWTYWHHLFHPRGILNLALMLRAGSGLDPAVGPGFYVGFARTIDFASRLSAWEDGAGKDLPGKIFSNQALNTWVRFGVRASHFLSDSLVLRIDRAGAVTTDTTVIAQSAGRPSAPADLFITDPPYADAIVYHEITEVFIAWLRKRPPVPFDAWSPWDSRRAIAIQGKGDGFRKV